LLIIVQFDLMNSRTFKDLCNKIQGFSSTCPVFKYFQGFEFKRKKFKYFQGCVGNLVFTVLSVSEASFWLQLWGPNFKALRESRDQKTFKIATIACQILNSSVTNRNIREQFTADCDNMSI